MKGVVISFEFWKIIKKLEILFRNIKFLKFLFSYVLQINRAYLSTSSSAEMKAVFLPVEGEGDREFSRVFGTLSLGD